MNCLKCGKETEQCQVFCKDCQKVIRKYPVNPNTPVHLPQRDPAWDKKPNYEREQNESDIIAQLKRMIRWLTATVAILSVLLCLLAGLLFINLDDQAVDLNIGKNYSTIGTDNTP